MYTAALCTLCYPAGCYLACPFGEHQQPQKPLLGVVEEEEEPPFPACNGGLFCRIRMGRCHCTSLAAVSKTSYMRQAPFKGCEAAWSLQDTAIGKAYLSASSCAGSSSTKPFRL